MAIYYETARDGLVLVEFVRHEEGQRVLVRVLKDGPYEGGPYKLGELIETSPQFIVEKAGTSGGYLLVRQARLHKKEHL